MRKVDRVRRIVNYVNTHGTASLLELQEVVACSAATIRRDLDELAEAGRIRRVRGGACRLENGSLYSYFDYTRFEQNDPAYAVKEANAHIGVSLVNSGDRILLGTGITCTLMARFMRHVTKLSEVTVVTSNVNAVVELADAPGIRTIVLGGDSHVTDDVSIETIPEFNASTLMQMHFQKSFFTVDGADLNFGYSIQKSFLLPLYACLLENASQAFLFLDPQNFGKRAFVSVSALDGIENVICSHGMPVGFAEYYKRHNVRAFTAESLAPSEESDDLDPETENGQLL